MVLVDEHLARRLWLVVCNLLDLFEFHLLLCLLEVLELDRLLIDRLDFTFYVQNFLANLAILLHVRDEATENSWTTIHVAPWQFL